MISHAEHFGVYDMILAGDIGGTKTVLGLFGEGSSPGSPLSEMTFSSQSYGSLEEIAKIFLEQERPDHIEAACFAVAGPVLNDTASVTNLPWIISYDMLSTSLGISRIKLINDVQAVACSVPILEKSDLRTLIPGDPVDNGTIAVIAVGTGLGESFLTWNGSSYLSHPTEGGHGDFGPTGKDQIGLLSFMAEKQDHVSWESVCSGIGIPNIYDYLLSTGRYRDALPLEERPEFGEDRTPAIIGAAIEAVPPCSLCTDTLKMFVSLLGAESGNLILKTMATGGLYLGGGIPPRILKFLESACFVASFKAKGRLTPMMKGIPVHVILNFKAALMGAAMEAVRISTRQSAMAGKTG
jgi:glucokinase